MADLDQAVPMPILVCSSFLAMIHLTRKSSMDANEKLGKATGTNILNQKYN